MSYESEERRTGAKAIKNEKLKVKNPCANVMRAIIINKAIMPADG